MTDLALSPKLIIPEHQRRFIETPAAHIRDTINILFDITPLRSTMDKGFHRLHGWYTQSAIFTAADKDAHAVGRTKAQAEAGADLVNVHRYLSGGIRGRVGDLSVDRDPGAVYIMDQASRNECIAGRGLVHSIFLPKSAIGHDPDRHPPLIGFDGRSPIGKALNCLLDDLFSSLSQEHAFRPEALEQLKACLRLGIGSDDKNGDIRRHARNAIRDAIMTFIEKNIENPELSVSTILGNFGVSRATLFRMFENRGGVRNYISERRLMRAVLDLAREPLKRGDITSIAEKWGFTSGVTFNRAVQREFGVAPGSLIHCANENVFHMNSSDEPEIGSKTTIHLTPEQYLRTARVSLDKILSTPNRIAA